MPVSIQLAATDPQGDPLTFSAAGLPEGCRSRLRPDHGGVDPGAPEPGVIIATDTAE